MDIITTKVISKFVLAALLGLSIVPSFAADSDSYYGDPVVQQQSNAQQDVVAAQQQISQAYDAKENYYNYCSMYSMYDDPMYGDGFGYGIPVWGYDYDNCDYADETMVSPNDSSNTISVTYPNIHKEDSGEVVFDQ